MLLPLQKKEQMSQQQKVEAATPAAGHHPALHLQSRHPQRASWLPSLVSPSEAPVGPRRKRLHTRGAEVLLVSQ